MSPQSWQFNVANSTCASQECLFRLYTDPRTRPLDVQAVLGSPVWGKDVWNLLPTINVDYADADGLCTLSSLKKVVAIALREDKI